MRVSICLGAAALLAASPAFAGPAIEGNLAHANDRWGVELGVGYGFGAGGFTIRPMVGALVYQGNGDRYQDVAIAASGTHCQDTHNGHLVDGWRCDNLGAKPYGRIEATYSLPMLAEIGLGARFSSATPRGYATAAFSFLPKIKLKANGGPHYYAAGLSVGF